MMKKLASLAIFLFAFPLFAQVQLGRSVQIGFGSGSGSGTVNSGTTGQIAQYPANGTAVQGSTVSGDCTLSNTGALTCTKTNGNPFSASATIDTTNAANISSGTLNAGRLPSIFAGANGIVFNTSPTTSRNATFSDIVPLWGGGTCSGYLKDDGTCGSGGGSSVGSAGTIQVAGSTAGSFAAGTTNQVNAALGSSNGLQSFGDSINQATGATSTGPGNYAIQNGFSYLWQQDVGGPFLLGGTSGDQEADVNYKWIYRVTNPQGNGSDPLAGHELGTNDAINYLGDANKEAIFQRLALGSLAWLATPRANKIFGQNCTLAGGMAADPAPLQIGLGVVATTSGATASCVISAPKANDTIYACYLIKDANGGTFTLSLDGTPQTDPFNGTTTWDAFGDGGAAILTHNLVTAGVACARFTGVSSGSHTVLFRVTSSTSSSNAVWPQWVGASPATSTLNPYVVAISPNQQNTGSAGAPYAATYAGYINTIATNLTADGENVTYSDTSNALLNDPSCGNGSAATMFANCYADNIHPNNLGHSVIHKTVYASSPASALLGVTFGNPKQQGQNFYPTNPPTPYQWFDVNPYNIGCNATTWCPGLKLQGGNGQFFGLTTNSVTGLTFMAPSGVQGFSFCPWGGSGFLGSVPPTSASCFMTIITNGLVNFFQGSTVPGGVAIQNNQFTTGTGVTLLSQGTLKITGANKNGVYSTTVATSGANNNSPCWNFIGGVWDGVLGTPGFDGPCLQFVPISPTPGGQKPTGYLTLQPGGTVTAVGLDLRNGGLTSHLAAADATSIAVGGSQALTSVQGTAGTKIAAASGSFTSGNLRSTNATGDEVDSTLAVSNVPLLNAANTFTAGQTMPSIGGTGTAVVSTGAGGATAVCATGFLCNSNSGTITLTTTVNLTTFGTVATATFGGVTLSHTPNCISSTSNIYPSATTTAINFVTSSLPPGTYTITYICMGN